MQHDVPSPVEGLPTGTVTMMFTDIAGSTELLRAHGDGYADLLDAHRRVVRDALAAHGGAEVDTQGDAFFAVFTRASDAAAAAAEITGRLEAAGPVRVRIGIHTGAPTLSAGGYVGMDVHRGARVAAAAHGGQVVLSQAARELIESVEVLDLGMHRLKDIGEMRLFQLGGATFPPLRTARATNLQDGPELVGRAGDVAAVQSLIEAHRLVTVTGTGGVGKTTLARRVAWLARERFADGAWFVDLSHVTEPALVIPEIAAALSSSADVAAYLAEREVLLVLDNLEQVLDAAPDLAAVADACPGVSILATSRAPLRLHAEVEYPLDPLGEADGAELFRREARAVAPRFDVPDAELARLSRHLDGLPLAIELAAARSRMLTSEQLLARLDRRLDVLVGGARDAPARHRTLEATIAWSFDLLEPRERFLFAALAVFGGECTLEAAEEVTGCTLDDLQGLVDKSLVQAAGGRFRMLEAVREYASRRFGELPDADALRERHAAWYAELGRRAEIEITGPRQQDWLDEVSREYPNLRVALDWCFTTGHDRVGARISGSLVLFWFLRGMYAEGTSWLTRAEAGEALDDADRSRVLWGLGMFATLGGRPEEAAPLLVGGRTLAEQLGDRSLVARIMEVEGLLAFFADDLPLARTMFERSIDLARTVGDSWCLADALSTIGSIYPLVGEFERAIAAGSEALAIARSERDPTGTRMALFTLALTAVRTRDLSTAREAGEEGLEICRAVGDLWFVSYFLWILSTAARLTGDRRRAADEAAEALRVARQLEAPLLLVCALEASAAAARAAGDDATAATQLAEAEKVGRAGGVPGSFVAEVLRASAELARDRGDADRAAELAREAVERARAVGDPWAEQRAVEVLPLTPR